MSTELTVNRLPVSVSVLMNALDESDGTLDPMQAQTELLTRALDDFRLSSVSIKKSKTWWQFMTTRKQSFLVEIFT